MNVRRWLPSSGCAALILVGTSMPASELPQSPDGTDKIVHFVAYGIFGALLIRAALAERPRNRPLHLALAIIAFVAVFAALDELHQLYVPNRTADILDWLADLLGASLASFLTIAARERREPST